MNLKINKTLNTNVPVTITAGEQEIHFTENGKIYGYDQTGQKVEYNNLDDYYKKNEVYAKGEVETIIAENVVPISGNMQW